jgi:hypothetical protein
VYVCVCVGHGTDICVHAYIHTHTHICIYTSKSVGQWLIHIYHLFVCMYACMCGVVQSHLILPMVACSCLTFVLFDLSFLCWMPELFAIVDQVFMHTCSHTHTHTHTYIHMRTRTCTHSIQNTRKLSRRLQNKILT